MGNLCLFADYAQKNHAPAIPADIKEFQANESSSKTGKFLKQVKENLDQTFGPVLWTQYTLHRGVMKMTASKFPPWVE